MIGRRIGNYVLQDKLGAGGMGEVYLAEHPDIGRRVAIKVLAARMTGDRRMAERFFLEARAIANVKHPNIIEIYDFGRTDDDRLYYVMEALEGTDLASLMQKKVLFSPQQVAVYLRQICGALEAAHAAKVIHRDLKPENIFVLSSGGEQQIKILDFGLVKLLENPEGENLTETGVILGSPKTISPEQATGMINMIGPRTDLYSLGVILYWMLAGKPPLTGDTPVALMARHITCAPRPLHETNASIPEALAAVIHQCLEKDPEDRPPSAAALRERYDEALDRAEADGLLDTVATHVSNVQAEAEAAAEAEETGSAHTLEAPSESSDTLGKASGQLRPGEAPATARAGTFRWVALGLVVALGGAGLATLWTDRAPDHGPHAAPDSGAAGALARPPAPPDSGTPDQSGTPDAARAAPDAAPAVLVRIKGAPRGAKVIRVDTGERIATLPGPVRLPRSETPIKLRIQLRGYQPATRTVVPSAPRTVTVTLKRKWRAPGSELPGNPFTKP